ncbi:MAG: DUF4157 domain-containing protein [Cyanobacteria bacterium P01_F01_bin.116]
MARSDRTSKQQQQESSSLKNTTLPPSRPFLENAAQAETTIATKAEDSATPFHFDQVDVNNPETAQSEPAADFTPPVQAQLTLGQPGDKYEQEADNVARAVIQQIHSPQISQREDDIQRSPLNVSPVTPEFLQRDSSIPVGPASSDFENNLNKARGGGSALDPKLQQQMGSAMGADFSGVKIHTDNQSDQLNRTIQAKAFTTGQDVFFKQGEYQPQSRKGQELIAHELTHVVQQSGGSVQRTPEAVDKTVSSLDQNSDSPSVQCMFLEGVEVKDGFDPIYDDLVKNYGLNHDQDGKAAAAFVEISRSKQSFDTRDELASAVNLKVQSDEESSSDGDVSLEAGPLTYKNGVVTVPIWGDQELKFGKTGEVSVSGELPSTQFDPDLPSITVGVDIPFGPGVYATASLSVEPKLSFKLSGGSYAINASSGNVEVGLTDATAEGTMGLDITARAGVGVGGANIIGLDAGVFGTLGAEAKLSGALGCTATFGDSTSYSGTLGMSASADIFGEVGAFVRAKAGPFSLTKDYPLAKKTFAHYAYDRQITIGGDSDDWTPDVLDFCKKEYGDRKTKKTITVNGNTYEELSESESDED